MSTVSAYRTEFLTFSTHGSIPCHKLKRLSFSPTVRMDSKSFEKVKKEEPSIQLQTSSIPQLENPRPSILRFDRLQPSDQELLQDHRLEFGRFVAREAVLDEEFWTAAWLRAESHWEDRPGERYVDSFKRQFAEQEFNAIKRRYSGQHGRTYTCVTVRKEERNVKRTVLKSVVGTLDFSFRHLLHGESFPGEREKHTFCGISRTNLNRCLCFQLMWRNQPVDRALLAICCILLLNRRDQRVWNQFTCMFIETTNLLLNCTKRLVSRLSKLQTLNC
ncbi:putative protein phosphatase 2C 66-like isoform X1 [Hibiscus syriacus]|uniref:Uncharacterized protein n=1 Tax=Hibiscus syriacus TaxID=106335 RepID=A0A6A2XQU6_HIBSY|nr:putative protein phosphatase 2C 66-like isoform X1 [Hibiscus syriacus]